MESCKLEPQSLLVVHGCKFEGRESRKPEGWLITPFGWGDHSGAFAVMGQDLKCSFPHPRPSVPSLPTKDSQSLLHLRMPIGNSHFFICFINFLNLLKISFPKILTLNYIFLQCFGILYHFGNSLLQLFLFSYHQSVFILFILLSDYIVTSFIILLELSS